MDTPDTVLSVALDPMEGDPSLEGPIRAEGPVRMADLSYLGARYSSWGGRPGAPRFAGQTPPLWRPRRFRQGHRVERPRSPLSRPKLPEPVAHRLGGLRGLVIGLVLLICIVLTAQVVRPFRTAGGSIPDPNWIQAANALCHSVLPQDVIIDNGTSTPAQVESYRLGQARLIETTARRLDREYAQPVARSAIERWLGGWSSYAEDLRASVHDQRIGAPVSTIDAQLRAAAGARSRIDRTAQANGLGGCVI
jgi:hypothetical protein